MLKYLAIVVAAATLNTQAAFAQSQPHAAFKDRPIKALSPDEIANLRAGRGMGMALPAELNRYPGPMHVLENDAALELSPEQREALRRQVDAMRAEAISLGEQVIALETVLDSLFKSGAVDAEMIDQTTATVAALYGKLRAVHLRTHLATRATLTETQLVKYETLRGYDTKGSSPAHKH